LTASIDESGTVTHHIGRKHIHGQRPKLALDSREEKTCRRQECSC
jgi:hypothetical protein